MFAAAFLLAGTMAIDASQPLSVAVSPAHSFAPANLIVRIHVEPDRLNRALEVVAESGAYYRSSRIELDGADAPRTIAFEYRDLPGGDYDVRGTLISSTGKIRAAVHQQVIVIDSASSEGDS